MGRRKRLHRQAVIAGRERPFRASNKPMNAQKERTAQGVKLHLNKLAEGEPK